MATLVSDLSGFGTILIHHAGIEHCGSFFGGGASYFHADPIGSTAAVRAYPLLEGMGYRTMMN